MTTYQIPSHIPLANRTAINTVIMEAAASFQDHGLKGRAKFLQSSARSAIAAPAAAEGAESSSSIVKTESASTVKMEPGTKKPKTGEAGQNEGVFDSDLDAEKKQENCETAKIDNPNPTPADHSESEVSQAQDRGQDGNEHHGAQGLGEFWEAEASDKEHHGAEGLGEVPAAELHGSRDQGGPDEENTKSNDPGLAEITEQQDATAATAAAHDVPAGQDLTTDDVPAGEDLTTTAASIGEVDAAAPVEEQSETEGKKATLSSGASPPSTATARAGEAWRLLEAKGHFIA